ncbi:MAG: hypothetical protein A2W98_08645 [Bacteroidetes bacterium GWF2_33_38]|nr:MAG: hypothetical protein A2W98_08645 [Bacteroidetes bacterium GWF2_33_38]OFY92229.1 MAG: hypothetical protein A2236_04910 [Bacteroidetes bacterium RIFOXYA2_FULL_33_7]
MLLLPIFSNAQIIDDFSDGDFINNPVWTGDVSEFEISSSTAIPSELRPSLRMKNTVGGISHIFTENIATSIDSFKWEFWLKIAFNPTTGNYGRVYLVSDSTNLEGNLEGYYVSIGEFSDRISLCKQSGASKTEIIQGLVLTETSSILRIKVTRDETGLWSLYCDNTGGTNYQLQGTVTNNDFTTSSYFGFYCLYTTTYCDDFYFDDIFVGQEVGDTIKPELSSIDVLSVNSIKLNFTESLDSTIAETLTNYSVDNSIGNPTTATFDSNNNDVTLTFATNFTDELLNTLSVQNIADLSGNIIDSTTVNFTYTLIKALSVELVSATQLTILFSQEVDSVTAKTVNNYLVDNGIGNPLNATVNEIDSKIVHLTFSSPFISGTTYSLNVQNVTDLNANPILSTNLNFLYFVASLYDVVINEIFADPSATTPTVIGSIGAEYFELFNTTNFDIPLLNWTFDAGGSVKTFTNITIPSNDYLIICTSSYESSFSAYGTAIGMLSTSDLTNSGTFISLKDNNNNTISEVSYDDAWYQDAVKDDGGWSLEKIDPENNCGGESNWSVSLSSTGGTPGAINSVDAVNVDLVAPLVNSVLVLDSNTVAISFSEVVAETFGLTDFTANNSIGNPSSADFDADNNTILYINFDTIFASGVSNTLDIENIADNCGNTLDSVQFTFSYFEVSPYDVVINEIMADPNPVVDLPDYEYIELYNRTNYDIDMIGWTLTVDETTVDIPSCQIQAGGFLLICSNYAELSLSFLGAVVGIYNVPALVNTGKLLTIKDNTGNIITSVEYSDTWYNDAAKNDGGWSLELIDPNNTCGELYNWTASIDSRGGTPGIQNSVFAENIDTIVPTVSQSLVYSKTHLIVGFSEVLNKIQAETAANYFVNNNIGYPDSARVDSDNRTLVHLYFSTEFAESQINALNLNNLSDLCDNPLNDTTIYFIFYETFPYDVVINEFMCDPEPSIGLPLYEYIELYNRIDHDIDLINWTLTVGTNSYTIPPTKILANDYLILCSHNIASTFSTYGKTEAFSSFPALGNTEATFVISDMYENIISTVSYTNEWYQNTYKDDGGWSLEQIDPENPCGDQYNWIASTDTKGGTPGAINSVNAENSDNFSPEVVRASIYNTLTKDTLQLFFDEPLDVRYLNNVEKYEVDENIGNPISIIPIPPDFKSIMLVFDTIFTQGVIYTVSVVDTIYDCVGNIIGDDNSCKFAVPDSIEFNDFVINEVLFDPYTNGVDFVEIYNRSDKNIDLKDVRIANRNDLDSIDNVMFVSETSYLMFPETFVVFTTDPEIVQEQYYAENPEAFIKVSSLPTFSNDIGNVVMTDKWLNILDEFNYSDDMHYALLNSFDGVSLERINYDNPTSENSNWHSAAETVGFATPTYQNSQYSPESTSTDEVTVEPELFSPDNDGYNDVLNIHYNLENPGYTANIIIFDSRGRVIKRLANNDLLAMSGTLTWNGLDEADNKASIGIYVVFFEAFDLEGNIVSEKRSFVLATKL